MLFTVSSAFQFQFFEFELQLYEHEYECQFSPMRSLQRKPCPHGKKQQYFNERW